MTKVILLFFLLLGLTPVFSQSRVEKLCLELCQANSIDFEKEIKEPFQEYLLEVYPVGNSDIDLYLSYMKYLFSENDHHQLLNQNDSNYITLLHALESIGIYHHGPIDYTPLMKLLKKDKSLSSAIYDILRSVEKNEYKLSTGYLVAWLSKAIEENGNQSSSYTTLIAIILAPYAITRNDL